MGKVTAQERIRLSENIVQLRKARGWTQQELARRYGTTQSVVVRWEQPIADMTLNTLEKIAEVFEVSMSDLLGKELIKKG